MNHPKPDTYSCTEWYDVSRDRAHKHDGMSVSLEDYEELEGLYEELQLEHPQTAELILQVESLEAEVKEQHGLIAALRAKLEAKP